MKSAPLDQDVSAARHRRNRREQRTFGLILAAAMTIVGIGFGVIYGPGYLAYQNYRPQPGDVLFQSLPASRLVNAIEGATESPFSHCGMVAQRDGAWVVYEAYRNVEATPLKEFIFRGRQHGFAVYRFKAAYQPLVPTTIDQTKSYLGRPYDVRYRMDDEKIYCSELIYKAFREASQGEELGALVRFGDLNWRPFEATIRRYERGPVPVERLMITPRDLARAEQFELVFAHRIDVAEVGDPTSAATLAPSQ